MEDAPEVIWYDRTKKWPHPAAPKPEVAELVQYVRADLVRAAMPHNADDPDDPELYRLAEVLGMTANTMHKPRSEAESA